MSFAEHCYIDAAGGRSIMCWVPRFDAARALTQTAALLTPSRTVGDWLVPTPELPREDLALVEMGGWYVDKYLCSAPDASAISRGSDPDRAGGSRPYVSQAGVAPMVDRTIGHFKRQLAARFQGGGFEGREQLGFPGGGGLIPDVYWNQLWVLSRLRGVELRGNTDHGRDFHARDQRGARDPTTTHGTLTGSGPASWRVPVDDFTGNRAEFTDGLRLLDGIIHTAGRRIDPPGDLRDPAWHRTGLLLSGVAPGQSVSSYRCEDAIAEHSLGATGVMAGQGGMQGQGLFYDGTGERVADRGSGWGLRELAPGKLSLGKTPAGFGDRVGARAILVP